MLNFTVSKQIHLKYHGTREWLTLELQPWILQQTLLQSLLEICTAQDACSERAQIFVVAPPRLPVDAALEQHRSSGEEMDHTFLSQLLQLKKFIIYWN